MGTFCKQKKKKKNVASVRKQLSADVRFDERERGNDNQATRREDGELKGKKQRRKKGEGLRRGKDEG